MVALVQIIVLYLTRNYILYLIVQIAGTVLTNILVSNKCNKLYPYIKNKPEKKLTKNEIGKTSKDVYALLIYKIASAVETGTDNIIATQFVGVIVVGFLSNYTLIIQSISSLLMLVFSSVTASIGNMIVSENEEHVYGVYRALNFASFWIYGVVTVCLLELIQPFIGRIWLGNQYLLSFPVVFTILLNFYISGTQNMNSSFRNAYGLFWQGRYRPVAMVVTNIMTSILLAKIMGLIGVFIGTIISRIFTVGIMDPYIVHKYGLHKNMLQYYIDYVGYLLSMLGTYFITSKALNFIEINSLASWVIKGGITFLGANLIFLLIYYRTSRFKYLLRVVKGLSSKK